MSEPKRITITILGKEYPIVTDEDVVVVNKAAHLIDQIMKDIVGKASVGDTEKVAVLAALQCGVDFVKEKETAFRYKTKTGELVAKLNKTL
jgi:cell division protein ZapA (FtsZ GTPase activity inhibitor)